MFKRMVGALESIANSLASILQLIQQMQEDQKKMIKQAENHVESVPQLFGELFKSAKTMLEGGKKNGE